MRALDRYQEKLLGSIVSSWIISVSNQKKCDHQMREAFHNTHFVTYFLIVTGFPRYWRWPEVRWHCWGGPSFLSALPYLCAAACILRFGQFGITTDGDDLWAYLDCRKMYKNIELNVKDPTFLGGGTHRYCGGERAHTIAYLCASSGSKPHEEGFESLVTMLLGFFVTN